MVKGSPCHRISVLIFGYVYIILYTPSIIYSVADFTLGEFSLLECTAFGIYFLVGIAHITLAGLGLYALKKEDGGKMRVFGLIVIVVIIGQLIGVVTLTAFIVWICVDIVADPQKNASVILVIILAILLIFGICIIVLHVYIAKFAFILAKVFNEPDENDQPCAQQIHWLPSCIIQRTSVKSGSNLKKPETVVRAYDTAM